MMYKTNVENAFSLFLESKQADHIQTEFLMALRQTFYAGFDFAHGIIPQEDGTEETKQNGE